MLNTYCNGRFIEQLLIFWPPFLFFVQVMFFPFEGSQPCWSWFLSFQSSSITFVYWASRKENNQKCVNLLLVGWNYWSSQHLKTTKSTNQDQVLTNNKNKTKNNRSEKDYSTSLFNSDWCLLIATDWKANFKAFLQLSIFHTDFFNVNIDAFVSALIVKGNKKVWKRDLKAHV